MLRKLFNNYKLKGKEPYEQIVGDSKVVGALVKLYKDYNQDITLICTYLITEFVTNFNFTKEELNAYKRGVGDFGLFLKNLSDEQDQIQEKIKKGLDK